MTVSCFSLPTELEHLTYGGLELQTVMDERRELTCLQGCLHLTDSRAAFLPRLHR